MCYVKKLVNVPISLCIVCIRVLKQLTLAIFYVGTKQLREAHWSFYFASGLADKCNLPTPADQLCRFCSKCLMLT